MKKNPLKLLKTYEGHGGEQEERLNEWWHIRPGVGAEPRLRFVGGLKT